MEIAFDEDRSNYALNAEIERFIMQYEGTAIGEDISNMYKNGASYEAILDRLGWDMEDIQM